jgi:hypothetical protein
MSTTSSRIRWTEVEKIALAQATDGYLKIYPGAKILKAIAAAQDVLPVNRRRKIGTKAEIAWIDEYLAKVAQASPEDNLFETAAQADRREAHNKVVALSSTSETTPPVQASLLLEPPPPDLNSVSLEELTKVWLSRFFSEYIAPQINQMTDAMVAKKMATMIEQIQVQRGEKGRVQIVVPQQVKKEMRPKVLVLGLLGAQITSIKQQYSEHLDLTLIGSDHNHDGLISLAKTHDIGIIMTRFVNHSQRDQVRNNSPHAIFVSGSTTDLGNILHSIVHEGQDKVKQHNFSNKTFA